MEENTNSNTNKKKILFVVIVLAVLLSSFFVLDFKAAESKTRANSQVAAYSIGEPQIDFPGKVHLYVEGDEALSGDIREAIRNELEKAGAEVEYAETFEERYDSQAMLVNVREPEMMYTPIYASSSLKVMYFYTSSGKDTKYYQNFKGGNKTVVFENTGSQEGEKLMKGELELEDSSRGIISIKAYRKYLAEEAAKSIVDQLEYHVRGIP